MKLKSIIEYFNLPIQLIPLNRTFADTFIYCGEIAEIILDENQTTFVTIDEIVDEIRNRPDSAITSTYFFSTLTKMLESKIFYDPAEYICYWKKTIAYQLYLGVKKQKIDVSIYLNNILRNSKDPHSIETIKEKFIAPSSIKEIFNKTFLSTKRRNELFYIIFCLSTSIIYYYNSYSINKESDIDQIYDTFKKEFDAKTSMDVLVCLKSYCDLFYEEFISLPELPFDEIIFPNRHEEIDFLSVSNNRDYYNIESIRDYLTRKITTIKNESTSDHEENSLIQNFKREAAKYGFFELPKVQKLSLDKQNILIDRIINASGKAYPKAITQMEWFLFLDNFIGIIQNSDPKQRRGSIEPVVKKLFSITKKDTTELRHSIKGVLDNSIIKYVSSETRLDLKRIPKNEYQSILDS